MGATFLVVVIIILVVILLFQLLRMNIYLIRIRKNKEVLQVQIKEDTDWEFIKGLY